MRDEMYSPKQLNMILYRVYKLKTQKSDTSILKIQERYDLSRFEKNIVNRYSRDKRQEEIEIAIEKEKKLILL